MRFRVSYRLVRHGGRHKWNQESEKRGQQNMRFERPHAPKLTCWPRSWSCIWYTRRSGVCMSPNSKGRRTYAAMNAMALYFGDEHDADERQIDIRNILCHDVLEGFQIHKIRFSWYIFTLKIFTYIQIMKLCATITWVISTWQHGYERGKTNCVCNQSQTPRPKSH